MISSVRWASRVKRKRALQRRNFPRNNPVRGTLKVPPALRQDSLGGGFLALKSRLTLSSSNTTARPAEAAEANARVGQTVWSTHHQTLSAGLPSARVGPERHRSNSPSFAGGGDSVSKPR